MLFQRHGGLQVQVTETVSALQQLAGAALSVELADPVRASLAGYDVLHVFSAINGNHRIIETARELGVPAVLSPLLSPAWNGASALRARIATGVARHLTGGDVQTSFSQIEGALRKADLLVALGEPERAAMRSAFRIPDQRIRIVPNGIGARFFSADGGLFRDRAGLHGDFALMVGAVSPYKNQLGVAAVLAAMGLPFAVIGTAEQRDQGYLRQLQATSGVRYLGGLAHDDPLLASAYAAASVFVLPSKGEVLPLTALEALASGTPVMLTDQSALDLADSGFAFRKVKWDDGAGQQAAIAALVAGKPERKRVQDLVRHMTWPGVARELLAIYQQARAMHAANG
ncbi:glycosyltransferase family 4 protein [Massilia sp. RP-1-19]|uniref:Glycosyltransferase family 4 protein n=2 Tax=Massilia polaris TaxID=2728846 RepID=A0A848HP60_9BURK|nr:glycosyltransferase family 4 protein [Massilia polaris]